MAFTGWPSEALDFYTGLEADNTKAYWQAHKSVYERSVKGPMDALADEVEEEFGRLRLFRPHRDVRFSKDKSPYKTATGAMTEGEGGEFHYVQLSAKGLMVASGYYQMASDQLERHRAALDDDRHGPKVAAIVERLEAAGFTIGAIAELKTAPRGYPRDHQRIHLLRLKGLVAMRQFDPAPWLETRAALDRVVGTWRACGELNDWLNQHVGPSLLAPPEADAW